MEFQDILYSKENGIATITLNRPETMNASSDKMQEEWQAALQDASQDDEVKVIVVTGAGRAFCAGGNPRQLPRTPEALVKGLKPTSMRQDLGGLLHVVTDLDKPYIGAINGPAVGGGMDSVSMCDIRIASERARFSMGYVRMGTVPQGEALTSCPG